MNNSVGRRRVLSGAGALLCAGTLPRCAARFSGGEMSAPKLELTPLDSSPGLISRITVCTRPFRAQGPRLDRRANRRKNRRTQLWTRRQRLVAVLGIGRNRRRKSDGYRRARHRGDRLRRFGHDIGAVAPARWRPRDHIREGSSAERAIISGHGPVHAGFAHLPGGICDAGIQEFVAEHVPQVLSDLFDAAWAARQSGRVHRQLRSRRFGAIPAAGL